MRNALTWSVFGLAVLGLGVATSSASAPPRRYYLALGDSIAYGFQPAKVGLPPSRVKTGYVDVVATRLRALAPKLRVVNYGCPGESTTTFIAGGCPWLGEGRKLHDSFRGAQLAAALTLLRAHPGQVGPVTLSLWGNDYAELWDACKGNFACVKKRAPRARARFASRLTTILGRLRAAAPGANIIVTGIWNFDAAHLKQTDPLVRSFDTTIRKVAASRQARFANTFPTFNPQGSLAREKARLCSLTFACSKGDPHPTNAGYKAIATAILAASG
jgi:lysophospholipase L1-like esterase